MVRWGSETFAPCCLGFSVGKIHSDDLAGLWLLRTAAISETLDVKFSSAQSCSVHRLGCFNLLHLSLHGVTVVALESFSGTEPLCFGSTAHAASTFSGLLSVAAVCCSLSCKLCAAEIISLLPMYEIPGAKRTHHCYHLII